MTSPRHFPPPWQVEQIPGGYKVLDANGQALVYVYARETRNEANIAGVLTFDEARHKTLIGLSEHHARNGHSVSVTVSLGCEREPSQSTRNLSSAVK